MGEEGGPWTALTKLARAGRTSFADRPTPLPRPPDAGFVGGGGTSPLFLIDPGTTLGRFCGRLRRSAELFWRKSTTLYGGRGGACAGLTKFVWGRQSSIADRPTRSLQTRTQRPRGPEAQGGVGWVGQSVGEGAELLH
jgi:hypothetical protein